MSEAVSEALARAGGGENGGSGETAIEWKRVCNGKVKRVHKE